MPAFRRFVAAAGLYGPARRVRRWLLPRASRAAIADAEAFYRALVAPGALCFDIGANVGEMSERLLRAGARVVAVEPQPECLAELRARCGGHPGLVTLPAAVGREAGVAPLYLRPHHAASTLRSDWLGKTVGTLEVPVVTLAALIERFGAPDYCKVDVEGAEEDVFATLRQPLPLASFEFHRSGLERAAACLEILGAGHDAEVNVTGTGPLRFAFPEWIPADRFRRELHDHLAGPGAPAWGDVWVRTRRGGTDELSIAPR